MPDKPRYPTDAGRKQTPHFGGVTIPPKAREQRPRQDSTPDEQNFLEQLLHEFKGWQVQIEGRLDSHQEELRQLRESTTVAREIRQELREQAKVLSQLASDVRDTVRDNALQNVDLAKLEAQVVSAVSQRSAAIAGAAGVEAGHTAGKKASRPALWTAIAGLIVAVSPYLPEILKAIIKVLNQ